MQCAECRVSKIKYYTYIYVCKLYCIIRSQSVSVYECVCKRKCVQNSIYMCVFCCAACWGHSSADERNAGPNAPGPLFLYCPQPPRASTLASADMQCSVMQFNNAMRCKLVDSMQKSICFMFQQKHTERDPKLNSGKFKSKNCDQFVISLQITVVSTQ